MFKTESSSTSQRPNLFAQDDRAATPVNALDGETQTVLSKQAESGAYLRRQWRRRRA